MASDERGNKETATIFLAVMGDQTLVVRKGVVASNVL